MKYFYILISIILTSFLNNIIGNPISGKLVDHDGNGLANVEVYIHLDNLVFSELTDQEGNFTFNNITSVENDKLPKGYVVSENYPNPFNPKTRFSLSIPEYSQVNVSIYNVLGQKVGPTIMNEYDAGQHYVDLELTGLPNGVYLARFNINEEYTIMKKMMLLYGSQHLNSAPVASILPKSNRNQTDKLNNTQIDSLVFTSIIIGRHTFTDLPTYTGSTLELGEFSINRFCEDTPTVEYAGKTYNTIQIGNRCWLKENLDVGTMIESNSSGFLQTDNGVIEKFCLYNDPALCETYGGLYQWPEAMQYVDGQGAQGICPDGWIIPTLAEFDKLKANVNNKAAVLIDESERVSFTPTTTQNETGFSALLAGYRSYNNGNFYALGGGIYLWSSTINNNNHPYYMGLYYDSQKINLNNFEKGWGISVRCIKGDGNINTNTPPEIPNNPVPPHTITSVSTSTTLSWNCTDPDGDPLTYDIYFGTTTNPPLVKSDETSKTYDPGNLEENTTYYWKIVADDGELTTDGPVWSFETNSGGEGEPCPGIPTVTYAGIIYNTVQIGEQCWLKENLDVGTMIESNSGGFLQTDNGVIEKFCYDNDPANCETYGGMYEWPEAMQYVTSEGEQGICPDGWHIPTLAEFEILEAYVNGQAAALIDESEDLEYTPTVIQNVTGFSTLFTGLRSYYDGNFLGLRRSASLWSSTKGNSNSAYSMFLLIQDSYVDLYHYYQDHGSSIRCVQD